MKEYYPFVFIINTEEYYCIWYSDEKDGFITDLDKIKHFQSKEHLQIFAKNNNVLLIGEYTELKVDDAKNWVETHNKKIDCSYFLNYWNIVADMVNSLGEAFYGNDDSEEVSVVYNKLFYGNNIEAIRGNGEEYIPIWTEEEICELDRVIRDGLRIISKLL